MLTKTIKNPENFENAFFFQKFKKKSEGMAQGKPPLKFETNMLNRF